MKRAFIILLAALLLAAPLAHAQEAELRKQAMSYLTEVYGYTYEDAQAFTFALEIAEGRTVLRFFPSDHPTWVYTAGVSADGQLEDPVNPFSNGYSDYPGQNSVMGFLYEAKAQGWFSHWGQASRQSYLEALSRFGIKGSLSLRSRMARNGLTADQAVDCFFQSCYGDPMGWTAATREWRDEVLSENGLTLTPQPTLPPGGNVSYTVQSTASVTDVTEFTAKAPEALAGALAHPKLAGWTLLCGATCETTMSEDGKTVGTGLAAFGQGERRLLAMLFQNGNGAWSLAPVGEKALLPEKEPSIRYEADGFRVSYALEGGGTESFLLRPEAYAQTNTTLCRFMEYRRADEKGEAGVVIDRVMNGGYDQEQPFHITVYEPGRVAREEVIPKRLPAYWDYFDASAFPRSPEECKAMEEYALPEHYGVTCGVHLRQKTSSRSADLGDYFSCALVEILETVSGDPYPWAHVRVGSKEGYMSTVYVEYPGYDCSMHPLYTHLPLPVAKTKKDLDLKKGTGWLDQTVQRLPKGAKLHVLAATGDWLHVTLPASGDPGWLMDVQGTDGYVKANDAALAGTSLQLDWLE